MKMRRSSFAPRRATAHNLDRHPLDVPLPTPPLLQGLCSGRTAARTTSWTDLRRAGRRAQPSPCRHRPAPSPPHRPSLPPPLAPTAPRRYRPAPAPARRPSPPRRHLLLRLARGQSTCRANRDGPVRGRRAAVRPPASATRRRRGSSARSRPPRGPAADRAAPRSRRAGRRRAGRWRGQRRGSGVERSGRRPR